MESNFNALIAEVKTQSNIVDIVSARGVELHQSGSRHKALCPFHNENTPSFTVDDYLQSYHCFGCGEGGDVISFVQKFDNTDFIDALRLVGEASHVADLDNKIAHLFTQDENTVNVDYKVLRKCLQVAADFYSEKFLSLRAKHPARKMVTDRGLPDKKEEMQGGEFYLGYAPKSSTEIVNFLTEQGFDEGVIVDAGLAKRVEVKGKEVLFDTFTNRLMFAFKDNSGRVIGFSGRKLNDEDYGGKYINTADSPLFNKSNAIFNFSDARREIGKEKKVFVVEGQFDVFALRESGVKNVVAVSGTAVTEGHIRVLSRAVGTDGKMVFCLDGDTAGEKAAVKTVQNHPVVQNRGTTISFPEGSDPCDVYQKENGASKLREILEKDQKSVSTFIVDVAMKDLDLSTPYDKQKALNNLSTLCAPIDNNTFVKMCAQEIAKFLLLPVTDITERIKAEKKSSDSTSRGKKDTHIDTDSVVFSAIKERFDEEVFSKAERMYLKMKDNKVAAIEVRILAIIARYPGFKATLKEKNFDFSFKTTVGMYKTMSTLNSRAGLIPENYGKYSPLVACIFFDNNLLPSLHVMSTDDIKEHLCFLVDTIEGIKAKERKTKERDRVIAYLIENSHKGVDELAQEFKGLSIAV